MTHIRVDYTSDRYETSEADPNDSWSRSSTAANNSVHGIDVVAEAGYRDITVPFDVLEGETYYLLWADYGTGDSFGHDDNQVEFIDLFRTYEAAKAAHDALYDIRGFSGGYVRDDGTRISVHVPWNGYFECLHSINITEVSVDEY